MKIFLIETLERCITQKIKKTRLLYRHDPFNAANIHKYIDGKENIILVARAENDYIITAFTSAKVEKTISPVSNSKGLLISLNSKNVFPLISGKKAITYDHNNLIFGSNELCLKPTEKKIVTKFGVHNRSFDITE